jgi:hypothetical protein
VKEETGAGHASELLRSGAARGQDEVSLAQTGARKRCHRMDDFSERDPELDRRPPAGVRQWLMPTGRWTLGSWARVLAAFWVGVMLVAAPPVLIVASREAADRADHVTQAGTDSPAAAEERENLRSMSGTLMMAATVLAALALVLLGQLLWRGFLSVSPTSKRTREPDDPPDGGG